MNQFDFNEAALRLTKSVLSSPHPARLMRRLCREAGPRPPASKGFRKAQEILRREWLAFGATEVRQEPVAYDAWEEGPCEVKLIAPGKGRIEAIQAIHSATGTVEAPVVEGGHMTFADLHRLGDTAHGAIVLMDGHVFTGGHFEPIQKRISLAEAVGAAAVLIVGPDPSLPGIQFLNRARIPVVAISAGEGKTLRRLLRRGTVRVRLHTSGRTKNVTCHNLIGELAPSRRAKETILACAHMDTFYLSPAAMDNTSGVVAMTEVARALAPFRDQFARTLRFIAFTGEEYGYAGSKDYVRAHADELDRTRFVLSMDCMFESTAKGVAVMWSPPMRNYIARTLDRSRLRVDVRNRFCMSSDYLPFMLVGVPTARPADWCNSFPRFTHTIADNDEKVPARWLTTNAAMCATVLLRMLTDPKPLPSRRKSPEEVSQLVRDEGAEDILRWQVLLPSGPQR